jgi:hypothetical protein
MAVRQTSIDAYNKLKASGKVGQRRLEIYGALFLYGPATSNRLKRQMRTNPLYSEVSIDSAEKRLTELTRMGLVVEVGTEVDLVTGSTGMVFDCTNLDTPISLTKEKTVSSFDFGYRKALLDVECEVKRRMLLSVKDPDHAQYVHRVIVESIVNFLRSNHAGSR